MAKPLPNATIEKLDGLVIYKDPSLSSSLQALAAHLQLNYLLANCPQATDLSANPDPSTYNGAMGDPTQGMMAKRFFWVSTPDEVALNQWASVASS